MTETRIGPTPPPGARPSGDGLPAPFGKYELLERIATGGMAEIFLARSFGVAGFEKRLVIKRIRPELAQNPRFVSMFIDEARIAVGLNHPNIVQTYDLGRVGVAYYMAMELLDGHDLNRIVKALRAQERRVPVPVAVRIIADALAGLGYAHSRRGPDDEPLGLVHRDVSPHNLVVTFAGEVKLVDFGIARLMNTAQGQVDGAEPGRPGGGKYAYMSPEQAWGEAIDLRSDVFSAGIVLWELIAGHRLFQDPDPGEKLRRVRDAVIPDPRDEGVALDEGLWRIIQRALARSRDDRYPDAARFEEDLRAWLYEHARVDAADVAALVREAIPQGPGRRDVGIALRRIADDVEQLDRGDATGRTPSGTVHDTPMPAHLRPAHGERKSVAALVVDVDGLTELSARVEPEDLFRGHYRILRWLRRIVDRHGGLVVRTVDDQVLVLFGANRTRTDDLPRALACALELQARASDLRSSGIVAHLAIGAHSGEVTVGASVGHQVRYVARGDTTRLARKLSALADHGETLVSEEVARAAEGSFRFAAGRPLVARGGKPAIPTYQLLGAGPREARPTRRPWVRRGREIDALRAALATIADGRSEIVTLVGEVGSGKTRLIAEIADLAARRNVPMFVGRLTPFGSEPGLAPVRALFQAMLGLPSEAPLSTVKAELPRLAQLGLDDADRVAISAVLGVGRGRPGRDETSWLALRRALRSLSRERPAIVVLEDLHHAEEGAAAAFRRTIRGIDGAILFVLTHAPPPPPELASVGPVVVLGPLPAEGQRRLLAWLLAARDVTAELWALADRTCEGNPLYLEEMVKYLQRGGKVHVTEGEAGLVAPLEAKDLPSSLTALVAARIDALEPAAKGLLQLAAAIGMEVSATLLAAAAGVDDASPILHTLAGHALVVGQGGDAWLFASELVREATLRSTLVTRRRDHHRLIAAAMAATSDLSSERAIEALSVHLAAAGQRVDAARHQFALGQRREAEQRYVEAKAAYQRGLAWVSAEPTEPGASEGEATLLLAIGNAELWLGDLNAAGKALTAALEVAADHGYSWIEVPCHVAAARLRLQRGQLDLAGAHLTQAAAQPAPTQQVAFDVLELSASLAFERGDGALAEQRFREALTLAADDPAARARSLLGLCSRALRAGDHDRADTMLREALAAARAAKDRLLIGRALNNLGLAAIEAGRYEEALEHLREAAAAREGLDYSRGHAINLHNIGDCHLRLGDRARAHVAFTRSLEVARRMGWDRGVVLNDLHLAFLDGDVPRIDALIRRANLLSDPSLACAGGLLAAKVLAASERAADAVSRLRAVEEQATRCNLTAVAHQAAALRRPLEEGA